MNSVDKNEIDLIKENRLTYIEKVRARIVFALSITVSISLLISTIYWGATGDVSFVTAVVVIVVPLVTILVKHYFSAPDK